jgi:hypothetical protein
LPSVDVTITKGVCHADVVQPLEAGKDFPCLVLDLVEIWEA